MKSIFSIIALIMLCTNLKAQNCTQVKFSQQSQIEALSPLCSTVYGNVEITGNVENSIWLTQLKTY